MINSFKKLQYYSTNKTLPCSIIIVDKVNKPKTVFKKPLSDKKIVGRYLATSASEKTTNIDLNFKRLRFFPLIRPSGSGKVMFNMSLGCLSKFLNKGKSFTKKKSTFILVGTLLRRVLLYSNINSIHLHVLRMPIYFQEVLNSIHTPNKSVYKHPFVSNSVIDESSEAIKAFDFKYVSFNKVKSYGYVKWKKKGRLKRKIAKRIYTINRVID